MSNWFPGMAGTRYATREQVKRYLEVTANQAVTEALALALSQLDADTIAALGLKANQTDLDLLDGRVDDAEAEILLRATIASVTASLLLKTDLTVHNAHAGSTTNPHSVTATQVGLGNVDNTSDAAKPVSTAQQAALNLKADGADLTAHVGNTTNPHVVTKDQVGLGLADNTADIDKPISTAVQAALDTKANHGYVDIDFPIIIRDTGPSRPTIVALTGDLTAPQWAVGNWLQIEGQEIVHGYREGTPIQWHAHVLTAGLDATDRYFRLEVKWAWVNAFGQLSAQITTTSPDLLIPADTPDRTMIPVVIDLVDMPLMEFGAHVWARLERVAAVGTAPTNDIFLSMLQLHVDTDKYGVDDLPGGP